MLPAAAATLTSLPRNIPAAPRLTRPDSSRRSARKPTEVRYLRKCAVVRVHYPFSHVIQVFATCALLSFWHALRKPHHYPLNKERKTRIIEVKTQVSRGPVNH